MRLTAATGRVHAKRVGRTDVGVREEYGITQPKPTPHSLHCKEEPTIFIRSLLLFLGVKFCVNNLVALTRLQYGFF